MPIPAFNENGLLPKGVHVCTMREAEERFGHFQGNDRRVLLCSRFKEFIDNVRRVQIVAAIVLNGSFVTATAAPNDIDLIVVVRREHDFERDLTVAEYGILSKVRVHRFYGFDILVAQEGTVRLEKYIEFFQQVRLEPGKEKGIVWI